jgi:hypothetical protein
MYTRACSLSRIGARHERFVCGGARQWDCDRRLGSFTAPPCFPYLRFGQSAAAYVRRFRPARVTYLRRERRLDFRHRQAKVGSISVNSLQWGAGVMVNAPQLRDFYLLQFTLEGECELWQESHHDVLRARSVAIVNPGRPFRKAWIRLLALRVRSLDPSLAPKRDRRRDCHPLCG